MFVLFNSCVVRDAKSEDAVADRSGDRDLLGAVVTAKTAWWQRTLDLRFLSWSTGTFGPAGCRERSAEAEYTLLGLLARRRVIVREKSGTAENARPGQNTLYLVFLIRLVRSGLFGESKIIETDLIFFHRTAAPYIAEIWRFRCGRSYPLPDGCGHPGAALSLGRDRVLPPAFSIAILSRGWCAGDRGVNARWRDYEGKVERLAFRAFPRPAGGRSGSIGE